MDGAVAARPRGGTRRVGSPAGCDRGGELVTRVSVTQSGDATERGWAESRRRLEALAAAPRPLLRPAPRSAMFFPLVVVVAVLPGLYALNWWDLNPPGPWWGLRGLAVLEGRVLDQVGMPDLGTPAEIAAYRRVALQPPLYAWLEALGLGLGRDRDPLMTVLPSYAAGALVVMLVYLHGRLWAGMGLGLTAAVLTGFNRDLLVQMQQATPTTLGLAGLLAALLCYGQFQRAGARGAWGWAALGGLALGLSLMAVGLYALLAAPIVLLHQAIVQADPGVPTGRRAARWWRRLRPGPSLRAGLLVLGLALLVAGPWHALMAARHGYEFLDVLRDPPRLGGGAAPAPRLLITLLALTPATLPLGLFAAVRAARQALATEGDDPATLGGVFWLAWLAVAALAPTFWPSGPREALALLMLVPLNLLAAQAMTDLAARRIPARVLVWLAPATAVSVAWWLSDSLREAIADLSQWQRPDAATLLGLHLGLDLIVILALATRRLDLWARRRDDRRRLVLGSFLLAVLAVNAAAGLREVRFRHIETAELLDLRDVILRRRREQDRPFNGLFVIGPEAPPGVPAAAAAPTGGRLRFILRATLPHLALYDLAGPDELRALPRGPDARWLVILIGPDQRLPYPMQSQLGLEMIYPTGTEPLGSTRARRADPGGRLDGSPPPAARPNILVAFATKTPAPPPRR